MRAKIRLIYCESEPKQGDYKHSKGVFDININIGRD